MKVVIVGTGNVATVLGQKIYKAGNKIVQVIGRSEEKAGCLASLFNSDYSTDILKIKTSADLYILAVSDNAITEVAKELKLNNKLVVHTAASVSKKVLNAASSNYGVLYPLQSLKAGLSYTPVIPVLLDANTESNLDLLKKFAEQWADSVSVGSDEERIKLHVAAVFVSNFTNHLFAMAEQYSNKEGLKFNLLQPLIEETVKRIVLASPQDVQTGPAVRNDTETLQKHLNLLLGHQQMLGLYKNLTNSIQEFKAGKDD